jgi:hypothetical protein
MTALSMTLTQDKNLKAGEILDKNKVEKHVIVFNPGDKMLVYDPVHGQALLINPDDLLPRQRVLLNEKRYCVLNVKKE